ncbi:MAG TPA: hypothetical protein VFL42_01365 [Terriglobales bacterium]|nr:hypothetical protein [Terriglobales bacterium]
MTRTLVLVPLLMGGCTLVYALIDRITGIWRVREMPLLLRRIDLQLLDELLDPAEEAKLRRQMSARAFRRAQRGRILAAREQIRRVGHNARIFRKWGNEEYKLLAAKNRGELDDGDHLVLQVIRHAAEAGRAASFVLAKIVLWRMTLLHLWPMLPSPSLYDLRESLGGDLLQRYEMLTASAGQLLLTSDQELYELVRAAQ